jgi:hypothetical protein
MLMIPHALYKILLNVGLLATVDGYQQVVEIHEHVPPPSVRLNSEKNKIRMRRKRAHDVYEHSWCLPEHCPKAPVTGVVTRNPGTGRDGTGQAYKESSFEAEKAETQTETKGDMAVQERNGRSNQRIDSVTGEIFPGIIGAVCDHPLTTALQRKRGLCNRCYVEARASA